MEGKFSILMNCYNGEEFLKEAIDSVYNQSYSDWEIIFIDNSSTDKSAEIARSYDDRLKYYKTPRFMTLCEARVFAFDFIDGDYLTVLDVDDVYLENRLEEHAKAFSKNEEIGLIYSNTIFFNSEKEHLYYNKRMPSGNIFGELLKRYFLSFETVSLRLKLLRSKNLYFSPKYNVCSDMELFIKTSLHTKALYIDKPLAKWRYGHVSESDRKMKSFPEEKELLLTELDELIIDFRKKYKKEIKLFKGNIKYLYGKVFWCKGDIKLGRKLFFEASKYDIRYLIIYMLTFFFSYSKFNRFKSGISR